MTIVDTTTGEIVADQEPQLLLSVPGVEFTPTAMIVTGPLEYSAWALIGRKLQFMHGAIHWWLGDWIKEGERRYGQTYAQAIQESPYTYGTLANDKFTAERVESSRRRENLSFSHHQEIAALEPDEQDFWLEQAESNAWTRQELRQAIRDARLVASPEIPAGQYPVILADPPWEYSNSGLGGSAEQHYSTMNTQAICDLPISQRTPANAVLFLWVTNPMLKDGLAVLNAWGFEYKTNFCWVKDRANYGKLGFYNYGRHELLFVGTKGSMLPRVEELPESVIELPKSEHSRKPDEVYDMIEQMYGGPYLELFARRQREGWANFGNEVR